jgi:[acyl-carrier-protein] S-malonyltransferase
VTIGREVGSLCVTAHNGDEEWVLGGDETALARVVATCRATRLPIAGPWHTPALAGAVDEYRAALTALSLSPLRARVIANRDGSVPADDEVIELLVGQLVHPVSWVAMLRTAIARGSTRMLAVGPGKTLRALVQRTLGAHHRVDIIDSASAIA